MGALSMLALLLTHPLEFRTLVQYKLWHEGNRDLSAPSQVKYSGWDRPSMRRCWELLDHTSRSFAGVIKELDGELAKIICLFYLVLRALDTIEDDMTLPDEKKQPLLRNFYKHAVTPGWTFTESGPDEKDRILLVEYNFVSEELNHIEEKYREVIVDIALKMGVGMADYVHRNTSEKASYLPSITDYELYCHFVAGLVGEGLSRIWSASGKEAPWLGEQLELSNSMGLMLQKTNIIRDYREDVDQGRYFWPKEIWGREIYGAAVGRPAFQEMDELYKPGNEKQALWVLSGMVVDALGHAVDSLDYLRLLKTQSVFNFCAIPQTMAISTLCLVFMNYDMLQRNVKIRRAEAASLIMRSTNPRDVAFIFREYARKIHQKALPEDPSFLKISIACGKIEQWCEHHYPSFVRMEGGQQSYDPYDARSKIAEAVDRREDELRVEQRLREISEKTGVAMERRQGLEPTGPAWDMLIFVGGGFALVIAISMGAFFLLLKFVGDDA